MNSKSLLEELIARCPGLPKEVVQNHLDSLHDEYFRFFSTETIAEHIIKLHTLTPEKPVKTLVHSENDGKVHCTVLAPDYPSVFSLITGLLGATHFDIVSGSSFTYRKSRTEQQVRTSPYKRRTSSKAAPTGQKRKIIDFFSGTISSEASLRAWQDEMQKLLVDRKSVV